MKKNLTIFTLGALMFLISCSSDDSPVDVQPDPFEELSLPEEYFNYSNIELPEHYFVNNFPAQFQFQFAAIESDNTPMDNPTTDAGATLGRVLFYDDKLSANGTIACASCHKPEFGFSDPEVLSVGFDGEHTRRHSMGIVNARFYQTGKFFWDERAETLEDQVLMAFQDEVEMGLTLPELVNLVDGQLYYPPLFEAAFGDNTVTSERIAKALAQFIRSLVSVTSKYDQGRQLVNSPMVDFPNFTNQENLGKQLFNAQNLAAPSCNACHMSEAFVAPLLAANGSTIGTNNGLGADMSDLGIFESTGVNGHRGKFKVPSLKNIAIRPPYMHDGRFTSLEEVIDHYSTGIQDHPTLQPFLRDSNGDPIRYNFSSEEKDALVAFLNTLTDNQMLSDEKYSNPFKE